MFKFFFTAFLASALLSISIVRADVNAVGGFISHAGCDADTFIFVTSIQVSPAPNFFLTVTPTLSGLCPNAAGQMVNSTLNLNTCLENSNANLLWERDGMFQNSCGCTLQLPNLCCGCGKANGGKVDSGVCVDLNQGVAAADGKLNCDILPSLK
jgi:hypothetical protein